MPSWNIRAQIEKEPRTHRSLPSANQFIIFPILCSRPDNSFFWFFSPMKSLRLIIWRHYKWNFIRGIIFIFLVGLVLLFFYASPNFLAKNAMDALTHGWNLIYA